MEATPKQIKTQWAEIGREIKSRPLLVYITGITLSEWKQYIHQLPTWAEIERIQNAIRTDRTEKTARIKAELGKMIGYREAKQFSKKIGISDTTIRDIVEGKKTTIGYQSIDKLEIYINAISPEFEISVDNPLTKEKLIREEFDEISSELRLLSNGLMREAMEITEVAKKMKAQQNYLGNEVHPARGLEVCIERLIAVKEQLTILYETYIK